MAIAKNEEIELFWNLESKEREKNRMNTTDRMLIESMERKSE